MVKVLGVVGSPRVGGNTEYLVSETLRVGLRKKRVQKPSWFDSQGKRSRPATRAHPIALIDPPLGSKIFLHRIFRYS